MRRSWNPGTAPREVQDERSTHDKRALRPLGTSDASVGRASMHSNPLVRDHGQTLAIVCALLAFGLLGYAAVANERSGAFPAWALLLGLVFTAAGIAFFFFNRFGRATFDRPHGAPMNAGFVADLEATARPFTLCTACRQVTPVVPCAACGEVGPVREIRSQDDLQDALVAMRREVPTTGQERASRRA